MSKGRLSLIFRFVFILGLGYAGMFFVLQTNHWLLSLWFFFFALAGIFELIIYLEKSKRELATFLTGIKQNDFSSSYIGKSYSEADKLLHNAFTTITEEFKNLRKEKETNFHFLQAVVEHSGIPMIGYKVSNGHITLMNQAAKELLNKPFLLHLNALSQIDPKLEKAIRKLRSGEKELVKTAFKNQLLHLSVVAKELKLDDEEYKLISIHNIKSELDEKELEAWQKLIRVLTHEIKNSAIPISTLTEVINQMIVNEKGEIRDLSLLDQEELEDIRIGMQTVEKRSKGLVNFVNAYGKLAKLPEPKIIQVDVSKLLNQIENLVKNDFKRAGVKLTVKSEIKLFIMADPELIEQVLLNLIKNAKEALTEADNPAVEVNANYENNHVVITVKDNGSGIEDDIMENIFIPFYTTKKEGSGIGLSLSRQIMRAHQGTISVSSTTGIGTTFHLCF